MIGVIETAMAERIASASKQGLLGYRFKTVETYGGQLDDKAELAQAVNKAPAAWAMFLGTRQQREIGNGRWEMRGDFAVLVVAQNKRNEAATRHGGGGDVGSYQMAVDVQALLTDQTLGLDIKPLAPLGIKPFPQTKVNNQSLSILTVEFQATFVLAGLPNAPAAELAQPSAADLPLAAALAQAAGITDFQTTTVDWEPSFPLADTITLETAP